MGKHKPTSAKKVAERDAADKNSRIRDEVKEPEGDEEIAETKSDRSVAGDEGYEAWLSLQPVLEKLERRSDRLPPLDLDRVVEALRDRYKEILKKTLPEIRLDFSPTRVLEMDQAEARLEATCDALLYAADKHTIEGQDLTTQSREELDSLTVEAFELHTPAMHWLPVLLSMGVLTPEVAERIRAGRGRRNVAQDLRLLGEHFETSWGELKPLQKKQKNKELRLTKQNIQRMRAVGGRLTNLLAGKSADEPETAEATEAIDWRDQVIAIYQLLEDDYNTLRRAALYHFDRIGRLDLANELGTLKSYHRAAKPQKSKKPKKSKKEEKPDEVRPEEAQPEEAPDEEGT